jgi:hypothetical protein
MARCSGVIAQPSRPMVRAKARLVRMALHSSKSTSFAAQAYAFSSWPQARRSVIGNIACYFEVFANTFAKGNVLLLSVCRWRHLPVALDIFEHNHCFNKQVFFCAIHASQVPYFS